MENVEQLFSIHSGSVMRGCPPPQGRQVWYVDSRGYRHGPAFRWHSTGKVKYSATQYYNGQRQGPFRQWYESGQLEIEGGFVDDLPHGSWRRYDEAGQLVWDSTCKRGQLINEARSFYGNGQCSRSWENQQGKVHGRSIVFGMSGEKLIEEHYTAGLRHGELKRWQLGVLVEHSHWQSGQRHGPYTSFWWDGSPLEVGHFVAGQRTGAWLRYWYGGQQEWCGEYVADKRNGHWVFHDAYGQRTSEVSYCHDEVSELHEGVLPVEPTSVMVDPPAFEVAFDVSAFVRGAVIPVTIVTGFLGAGKTTAIQEFLAHRPTGEAWVVYVNEYGEVGIDGAAFPTASGLLIEELAGGCACCVSSLPFVQGLQQLLTRIRPDHLIIEPSGLADPWALESSITQHFSTEIDIRARLCLVDPRKLEASTYRDNPIYQQQLTYCDLLVANRCDLASEKQLLAFRKLAAELDKKAVLETTHGRIDPEWLTRISQHIDLPSELASPPKVSAKGWLFAADVIFDQLQLENALRTIMVDQKLFPKGWLRAKGGFRCKVGFCILNLDIVADKLSFSWQLSTSQRESRFECVAPVGVYEWGLLGAALRGGIDTP